MWQFISEIISDVTGRPFVCQQRKVIQSGKHSQCVMIRDERRRYFLKLRQFDRAQGTVLDAESDGLAAIENNGCIKTPAVICHGVLNEGTSAHEYLILQYLSLQEPEKVLWYQCGAQLAAMHRQPTANRFGWRRNNTIGNSLQRNELMSSWAHFYAEFRIGAMLELLAAQGHKWCNIDVCVTRVHQLLQSHQPLPSLLHGDLWHGNIGFYQQQPVIFDPAVYVGDRETDIAMTELFGQLPPSFYEGYQSVWPLDPDYAMRRKLYQLYHVLNHALLFGGHYLVSAKQDVNEICQQ